MHHSPFAPSDLSDVHLCSYTTRLHLLIFQTYIFSVAALAINYFLWSIETARSANASPLLSYSIHNTYCLVPHSTDFAVMILPLFSF